MLISWEDTLLLVGIVFWAIEGKVNLFKKGFLLLVILVRYDILLGLIFHVPAWGNNDEIETRWVDVDTLTVFGDRYFTTKLAAQKLETVNHTNVGGDEDVREGGMNSETCKLAFYLILSYNKMI